jgi:hypothetical protein
MQIYVNNVSGLDSGHDAARAFAPPKLSALRPGRRLRRNGRVRQSPPYRLAALAIPSSADGPTLIASAISTNPTPLPRFFSQNQRTESAPQLGAASSICINSARAAILQAAAA